MTRATHTPAKPERQATDKQVEPGQLGQQFQALRDAVLILDGSGTVIDANAAASEIFELAIKELKGRSVRAFIRFNSSVRDSVQFTTPTKIRRPLLLDGTRASGEVFPAELTMSRYRVSADGPTATVAIIRDLSERQRIVEIAAQRERLATIGEVMARMVHELSGPLTGIAALVDNLLETSAATDKETLRMIADETERASEIIGELLNFARRDNGPPAVSINEAVERAVRLSELRNDDDGIEIVTDLSPEAPVVLATAGRLQHVILNLIENGRHAIKEHGDGCVTVRTRSRGGRVCLEVVDNGVGIPADIRDRIFEPFFTTKEPGVGTGLGLAIVESIVSDFGGKIALSSNAGGTTIMVMLNPAPSQNGSGPAS